MLKLRDFLHLPQLDSLMEQLIADESGMVVLAGIEARSAPQAADTIAPSGMSAIFNILMQEILLARPMAQAVIVAEEKALARVPRPIKRRVRFFQVESPDAYGAQIESAAQLRPSLLVIDRLDEHTAPAAFNAAMAGVRVLAQVDTILRGAAVARQLAEMGVPRAQFSALNWILTTQRMSVLCERCRKPAQVERTPEDIAPSGLYGRLCSRYPHLRRTLDKLLEPGGVPLPGIGQARQKATFYHSGGCEHCHQTGYSGDMAVFDLFRNDATQEDFFSVASLLPLEEYALRLAAEGQIDLDDLLDLEADHLRRTYQMLTASERALTRSNTELNRKLIELEASNRVLVQRTEVLMSLQDLGQALITSTDLRGLAARICRRASELCGANHVVLYLCRENEQGEMEAAEILAVRGWDESRIGHRVDPSLVFERKQAPRAIRYMHIPPGFIDHVKSVSEEKSGITMGLRVPLMAQEHQVGVMIIQSTQKEFFTPAEMALLQTFANQAALAIQRAGLVEELREKIVELEAAQAELVKKERMERELELARSVQQSMLPHSFPEVEGFRVSARYEPARQVGGDFYDVIWLDDDHFGVVAADVADKGLPAALYMALTRSLLLAESRRVLSPRETLQNVNRLLLEVGDLDGFVSVFYGVVERSTHRMAYARAGHERPLLLRDGTVYPLRGDGVVLGTLEDVKLSEEAVDLKAGDRLVMYTDGLTDVADEEGHFSGRGDFEALVLSYAHLPADGMCRAMFEALTHYRGNAEQFDDMTLLVLDVN